MSYLEGSVLGIRKTHEQYEKDVPEDYEVLEPYVTNKVKILHKHLICGYEWLASPHNIISGKKCPKCSSRKKTHTQYEIDVSENYEILEPYVGNKIKILHKHLACGYEWLVKPNDIISGRGCPDCAGRNATKVYLIFFPELDLYKIGISNNPERRVAEFGYKADIVWVEEYLTHEEAKDREKELLSKVSLINTGLLKSGNQETFR